MPFLIDGYNLARTSRQFQTRPEREIDDVVRFVNRFARLKKTKATVVFDGFPPDGNRVSGLSRSLGAVKIIFAGGESDADTRIRKMISETRNRKAWTVVSSDRAIHGYARATGLRALRSEEFVREADALMLQAQKENTAASAEDIEYWLKVFNEEKQDS